MSRDLAFLDRREALQAALGVGAGAVLLGGPALLGTSHVDEALAASACTLSPEQEEGPFFVSLERIRSNIVGNRKGVPLTLHMTLVNSATCKPLKGAAVDVWQADATGVYSDESSENTVGQTWLRGVQITNSHGQVKFKTLWPGFYSGRAPHIHVKVHIGGHHTSSKFSAGHVSHNGQIFFSEATSTKVYKTAPYTSDPNTRTYRRTDRVYTQQHGSNSVLKLTGGTLHSGLVGRIAFAVNPKVSY